MSANGSSQYVAKLRHPLPALLLLVPAPTLGVLGAMLWFTDSIVGQAMWAASKVWIMALPLAWLLFVDRSYISVSPIPRKQMRSALIAANVTGVLIFALILGGYYLFGREWMDLDAVRVHLTSVGLDSVPLYLAMCVFWIVVNSAVEEYVWRWFVYTRLAALIPHRLILPGVAAGLAFTLHHVFALGLNFQWDWRIVGLASTGVFVGGVTWSILYAVYRSIWPGWISHAWADLAIFIIGYQLLFSVSGS
ncbi:MAG: CPBP family intramembrane metalloprotease [Phycisphaeraceae bacterium]|nr:CPBP family intramembrane metalloprotease [Phycisphaeraceae bacterium]